MLIACRLARDKFVILPFRFNGQKGRFRIHQPASRRLSRNLLYSDAI